MRQVHRLRSTGQLNISSMKHCIRTTLPRALEKMNSSWNESFTHLLLIFLKGFLNVFQPSTASDQEALHRYQHWRSQTENGFHSFLLTYTEKFCESLLSFIMFMLLLNLTIVYSISSLQPSLRALNVNYYLNESFYHSEQNAHCIVGRHCQPII